MICKTINKHLNSPTTIKSNLSWDKVLKGHKDVSERFLCFHDAGRNGLHGRVCQMNDATTMYRCLLESLPVCLFASGPRLQSDQNPPGSLKNWRNRSVFLWCWCIKTRGLSATCLSAPKHHFSFSLYGYFTIRVKEEARYAAWRLFLTKPFFHCSAHIWPRL